MNLNEYKALLFKKDKTNLSRYFNQLNLSQINKLNVEHFILYSLFKNLLKSDNIENNEWLKNFNKEISKYFFDSKTRDNIWDDRLFNLLPKCNTLNSSVYGIETSCEAFYQSNEDKKRNKILKNLYNYRLDVATKKKYSSSRYVMSKQTIYKIIDLMPNSANDLKSIKYFENAEKFNEHADSIINCIKKAEEEFETSEIKFIERGIICDNPQVIADISSNKNYLNYNLYDWLEFYGFGSEDARYPHKFHFGIKLAGYVNRIKELSNVLICHKCNEGLVPNWEYAKPYKLSTTYKNINGKIEISFRNKIGAAYRITVFQCTNKVCSENGNNIYINHCNGHSCYKIIDQRADTKKCDNGWLICTDCYSCCTSDENGEHIEGSCPDCSKPLKLFEKNKGRFVYCSNKCGFKILTSQLPKRFYFIDPIKLRS